jgi:hypothetical protein
LGVDPKTVGEIIKQKGETPDSARSDRIELDPLLLARLFGECDGYIQRMHEKLLEEHAIAIGYSTLTRKVRDLELGKAKNDRCARVPDEPGAEMQHDTTKHRIRLGQSRVNVVASLIYMRYSKMRYLKFYRSFNRFKMKCFLHEALAFWGYAAPVCIIDNTNLARLRGTGKNAVIVPEMERFSRRCGFEFVCHAIGHANRKAGNERSFFTVETNFFPGRKFDDLEDLNRQAFDWATVRMANRPVSKTGLIPARAFEYEQAFLTKLPSHITPPYIAHERGTDQYGYISFDGNYYWIPGAKRLDVKALEYADRIRIYHRRKLLAEYGMPPDGVKNERFYPPGFRPPYRPARRSKPTLGEEKKLRGVSETVGAWLNIALKHRTGKRKHHFIRRLYGLYRKMPPALFDKTIRRAFDYRIDDVETVERIAALQIREAEYRIPQVDIDEGFRNRRSFIDGRFTDEADLSVYKHVNEENDNG